MGPAITSRCAEGSLVFRPQPGSSAARGDVHESQTAAAVRTAAEKALPRLRSNELFGVRHSSAVRHAASRLEADAKGEIALESPQKGHQVDAADALAKSLPAMSHGGPRPQTALPMRPRVCNGQGHLTGPAACRRDQLDPATRRKEGRSINAGSSIKHKARMAGIHRLVVSCLVLRISFGIRASGLSHSLCDVRGRRAALDGGFSRGPLD